MNEFKIWIIVVIFVVIGCAIIIQLEDVVQGLRLMDVACEGT